MHSHMLSQHQARVSCVQHGSQGSYNEFTSLITFSLSVCVRGHPSQSEFSPDTGLLMTQPSTPRPTVSPHVLPPVPSDTTWSFNPLPILTQL